MRWAICEIALVACYAFLVCTSSVVISPISLATYFSEIGLPSCRLFIAKSANLYEIAVLYAQLTVEGRFS